MRLKTIFYFHTGKWGVFIPQNPDGSIGQCWTLADRCGAENPEHELKARGIHLPVTYTILEKKI